MRTIISCLIAVLFTVAGCQPDEAYHPQAATPYAIGSSTRFIHDFSRAYDSVAGVDAGLRILIAEIWYPVEHAALEGNANKYRRATYGDYVFGDREMHQLMMTKTTFFHLTPDTVREGVTTEAITAAIDELFVRERNSFVDAPVAPGADRWPVIVMTHGDAGSRYNMETACEYLAAHGYVVIAPEHTGNSPYSLTGRDPALAAAGGDPVIKARMADVIPLLSSHGAYGSESNYGQTYSPLASGQDTTEFLATLDRSLLQRVDDLRATLDELGRMNQSGPFADRLDLEKIGLMGRSFGGTTTLAGLVLEARFKAGLAVVPFALPDMRDRLPADLLRPADQESVLLSGDGPFAVAEFTKPTMLLSGAEDALLIGANATAGVAMGAEPPTPGNPHPVLRKAFETTRAPVVWGLLQKSTHASFGVSGSYWWPQLKPDTQPRYFEPETTFAPIDPQLAHRIQKEKSLEFFDATLREDETAHTHLLDNRFSENGLVLEARNF